MRALGANRLYGELAPWYHLLSHPSEHKDEARHYGEVIRALAPEARTLLELGSGGGNNASFLKQEFECTLADLSEEMIAISRAINPECEHISGDMRTLRLGRTFDVVFVHDAIEYMLTEDELRAAVETIAAHLAAGGVALVTPDAVAETFEPGTDCGGNDSDDGRGLRYVEWTTDSNPADSRFEVEFAMLLREANGNVRVEYDHHTYGLFARSTWSRLFHEAGLLEVPHGVADPYEGQHVVFTLRKRG
ncbi:MAG: trans-aconitate 2-methyltransferase [Dehalococcoidia bacterium]